MAIQMREERPLRNIRLSKQTTTWGHRRASFIYEFSPCNPVARQAHNLKVIGSNPIPATKL